MICSDVSEEALKVAEQNAALNGCKSVKMQKSNMFEAFNSRLGRKKFDLIISNPPYIESSVIPTLQREVKDYEPMMALDGGEDGLDFYRIIASEGEDYLQKNGIIMLEIGYDQGKAVTEMLQETGSFVSIRCLKDLAGKDRIVVARLEDKKKRKNNRKAEK